MRRLFYYFIPVVLSWLNSVSPIILRRFIYLAGRFDICDSSFIASNIKFLGFGNLSVGYNTVINPHVILDNRVGLKVGNNVSISRGCRLWSLGHDPYDGAFRSVGACVTIEDYCVLFPDCSVMPGVDIREGCVVLNGSIVTKSTERWSIYAGVPAVKVGTRCLSDVDMDLPPVVKSFWIR